MAADSKNTGYFVGKGGIIFSCSPIKCTKMASGASLTLSDIWISNKDVTVAVGAGGTILRRKP